MNNRLNIQDLAGLLSERTGKDRGEVERFLRDFISVVSEGVYTDKIVKVKGLGTFKIISVEKRERSPNIINSLSCRIKTCGNR